MIIGGNIFASAVFASAESTYEFREDWNEICPNINVWYDIEVRPSTIKRC